MLFIREKGMEEGIPLKYSDKCWAGYITIKLGFRTK